MRKYFSMILLAGSFLGSLALADVVDQAAMNSVDQGGVAIMNYPCPQPDSPGQPGTPRPTSIDTENAMEVIGLGGRSGYNRPSSCYTNGESCPPGYYQSNVRYCWSRGWYRCGYVCQDIYTGGGGDGGNGGNGGNGSAGGTY